MQLCTCNTNVHELKHYWIFYRFIEGQNNIVLGEAMLPAQINPEDDSFNQATILRLLNEGNIFDNDIKPVKKDRLELSFSIDNMQQATLSYGFEFKNNKWVAAKFDPLMWLWKHQQEKQGDIINVLEENV